MPGKPLTESGLAADVRYVLQGIACHDVLANICPPREGQRVLEPGCGSGKLGLWYALRGSEVTLLDIDPGVIEYSKHLTSRVGKDLVLEGGWIDLHVHHRCASVFGLTRLFGIDVFDFVFNEGVPQHWTDWRRQGAINQMVAVTKPGGLVCVIGSNAHCPAMMDYITKIDHTYAGMPPKQKPWTREEIRERLMKAGLMGVRVTPVDNAYFDQSMLLAAWGEKPQ